MTFDFDNSPIRPGIDGMQIKTFDELLDHYLREDNAAVGGSPGDDASALSKPKKTFLRKGTGLERFKPKYSFAGDDGGAEFREYHNQPVFEISDDEDERKTKVKTVTEPKQPPPRKRYLAPKKLVRFRSNSAKTIKKPLTKTNSVAKAKKLKAKPSSVTVMPRILPFSMKKTNVTYSSTSKGVTRSAPGRNAFIPTVTCDGDISDGSQTSTVENLEKLLDSVRQRKTELMLSHAAKSSANTSESENEIDSDYADEPRQVVTREPVRPAIKKTVRWQDSGAEAPDQHDKYFEPLDLGRPSENGHSSHLLNSIQHLEDKLKNLQVQCATRNRPVETNEPRSSNVHAKLSEEVNFLKEQISALTDNLKTLQVLTAVPQSSSTSHGKTKGSRIIVERNSTDKNGNNKVVPGSRNTMRAPLVSADKANASKDNPVVYYYQDGTAQTTYTDGSQLIEFPNGQIEQISAAGVKQITYPDKLRRTINQDGSEELELHDGTSVRVLPDGTELVQLPNGEREIRASDYNRREYRNGTTKTIYSDGTQETRYANGRLRIKDKLNNLLVDSRIRTHDEGFLPNHS